MKLLSLFVLLTFAGFPFSVQESETVKWYTIEEALKLNAVAPRNILIDVYTDWCGYCKAMDKETFGNPVIARYINNNFYAIKFDAESTAPVNFAEQTFVNEGGGTGTRKSKHQFATALGVTGYPAIVYFTSDLKLIGTVPGFQKPEQIEPLLHFIAD